MTDNEHNLSTSKIHTNKIDNADDIDQSMIAKDNGDDDDDGGGGGGGGDVIAATADNDDDDDNDGDDIVVTTNANVKAMRSSVKRRNYQRKRKSITVEQISSFLNVKNQKIPTPSSLRTTAKCEYDEKEVSSFFLNSFF